MDRIQNPYLKNQSSGLSGVFGGQSASPYGNNPMGSLPDLKQSKRESKWLYRPFLCLTRLLFWYCRLGGGASLGLGSCQHCGSAGWPRRCERQCRCQLKSRPLLSWLIG